MASQDFESFFKDIFGEPLSRITQFQSDQITRLTTKVQELAREAMKEELGRLNTEINELRSRVAVLEAERAQTASDSLQTF